MTPTPTSGAADLPEALRLAAAISNLLCSNEAAARTLAAAADELVRLHAESEMRRAALLDEMQKATLAAGQATAAQTVVQDDLITLRKPTTSAEMLWLLKLAHLVISDVDKTLEETFAPAQPVAQQGVAYAALPNFDDGEEPIWNAIFSWKNAERGSDAAKKAVKIESAIVDQLRAFADATHALRVESLAAAYCEELDKLSQRNYELRLASHGQAPAGANENAELVTLIAECRDAFPIPAHGDPIENYLSAAIEDPANVPAYLQEIAKRKQADSVLEDAARLDYLHSTGSTIEMLPGEGEFYPMRFRVGGLHSAVSPNLREAIDAARKQGEKQ